MAKNKWLKREYAKMEPLQRQNAGFNLTLKTKRNYRNSQRQNIKHAGRREQSDNYR